MGARQSRSAVQQPGANAKPAGQVIIWISYPKCVERLESAHFDESGFDLVLLRLKQVRDKY